MKNLVILLFLAAFVGASCDYYSFTVISGDKSVMNQLICPIDLNQRSSLVFNGFSIPFEQPLTGNDDADFNKTFGNGSSVCKSGFVSFNFKRNLNNGDNAVGLLNGIQQSCDSCGFTCALNNYKEIRRVLCDVSSFKPTGNVRKIVRYDDKHVLQEKTVCEMGVKIPKPSFECSLASSSKDCKIKFPKTVQVSKPKPKPVPQLKIDLKYLGKLNQFNNGNRLPAKIQFLVLHDTVTKTAQQAFNGLKARKLSVHYILDKDGTLYPLVDDYLIAQHAGCLPDETTVDNNGKTVLSCLQPGINNYSVGVEIVNWGNGKDPFTKKQYASINALIQVMLGKYINFDYDAKHIIGHYQINLKKEDPAKNFDWSKIGLEKQLSILNIKRTYKVG